MSEKTERDVTQRAIVGEFLKKFREKNGKSQREVGETLGYRNLNFISMMEKGASPLPPNRIIDIVTAYALPRSISAGLFSYVYEDLWMSMYNILCAGATQDEVEIINSVAGASYCDFVKCANDVGVDVQAVQSGDKSY